MAPGVSIDAARAQGRLGALWSDRSFGRGMRAALWSVLPAYLMGGMLAAGLFGSEASLGWILIFWERLYAVQWVWLLPAGVGLALLRRYRSLCGLLVGGAVVSLVHAIILLVLVTRGVR